MKGPYPVELVPLIPEFLTKRRTKFTLPLRLMEELGIDRPALFFVVGGVAPQGGGRYNEMWNPYATQWDQYQAASAAARDAGLVDDTHVICEIGDVFAGRVQAREDDSQVTIYKSLGHVVQDLAAADYLRGRADINFRD